MQAVSLVLNELSRATTIRRPEPLGHGKLLVAYIDLRWYAPRYQDREEWERTWEELQFDPALSQLITKGTLKFLNGSTSSVHGFVSRVEDVLIDTPPYTQDGKQYTKRWVKRRTAKLQTVNLTELKDIELIRLPDPTIEPGLYAELVGMTGSQAPVVTLDYFVARACATIKDKGLFREVYSGLYAEFAGIPQNSKKGSDLDNLLEQLGIGNVEQGVTADKLFEKLRSDQRAAKFRSGVTGSPRQGLFFPTLATRLAKGVQPAVFTRDVKNQSIDIDTNAMANLLDFRFDGTEGLFPRANGLRGAGQWDGKGKFVEEVPFDIAADSMIPSPHARRLQSSISCKRCHETTGADGWIKFENDVLPLTRNGKPRLDLFGDAGRRDVADTVDRLAGLYGSDPEEILVSARDAYAAAVLRATGPWGGDKGPPDALQHAVKYASGHVVKIWERRRFDLVTPASALRQLGIEASAKDTQAILNDLLAPDLRATTATEIGPLVPESPILGALRAGLSVTPTDFDLVSSFGRERARTRIAAVMRGRR